MRNEREIDDAIDRAVRDIMNADPRTGFRGRVLGRLEQPASATSPSWFTLPRFAAAMAVLAMAVAIAALFRTNGTVAPAEPPVIAQKQLPAPVEVRPVPSDHPAPVEQRTKTPAVRPRRDQPAVKFPPQGVVTAASVPDPAATTPAVRPDPAVPAAGTELIIVTPVPLVIAPLIIPPIVIPPIRPPR